MRPAVFVSNRVYPEAVDFLKQRCDVEYVDSDEGTPSEELLTRIRGKQAAVVQLTDRFSASVIGELRGVRLIANVGVGYDNIDVPAATRRGILVTNTPDVLTETTADLAFALLLASARRITEAHRFVHSGRWRCWSIDLLVGQDVYGRTLGIFGLGRIGQAVARRGRGFSMRILYHGRRRAPEALERELSAEYVPADRLLAESDFVSLHVPLNDSTRKLIGASELRKMKPTAILVNTSRGLVVDEAALATALAERTIACAGLDVFEQEPYVHPQLLQLENVVLAPHIGSASVDTRRRMCMMAAENVIAVLEGRRPPNLINVELWKDVHSGQEESCRTDTTDMSSGHPPKS